MGLFDSKKKASKGELPPLKFPELPKTEFPSYESEDIAPSEAKTIKQAVSPVSRRPQPMPAYYEEPQEFAPEEFAQTPAQMDYDQPLFVRIDEYKDVIDTLNALKTKLKEAGTILGDLDRIKEEEDKELAEWHDDLEMIKEKLMHIDQVLFE
ncbi:MAG: hypothetical protein ABIF40_02120 [archaeon]